MIHPRAYHATVLVVVLAFLLQPLAAQITEAVVTVQKGSWSVEMDAGVWAYDRHTPERDGIRTKSLILSSTVINAGVTDRIDFQVGMDMYSSVRWSGAESGRLSGAGDAYVRMKWNYAGKEGEGLAGSLLPWIGIPCSREGLGAGKSEYGILTPWSLPLNENTMLAGMFGLSSYDDYGGGRDFRTAATLCLTRTFSPRWCGYVEFVGNAGFERDSTETAVGGLGVLCTVNDKVQIGVSSYVGLNRAASDFCSFLSVYLYF